MGGHGQPWGNHGHWDLGAEAGSLNGATVSSAEIIFTNQFGIRSWKTLDRGANETLTKEG